MNILRIVAITLVLAVGVEAQNADPGSLLTQARLDADQGNFVSAARLFEQVAAHEQARDELRWEGLVGLGQMRQRLGEHGASVTAFRRLTDLYGDNLDAMRFLTIAVAGVAPAAATWEQIWEDVELYVDERPHPMALIRWPGFDSGSHRAYDGEPVSLHAEEASLTEVVRELGTRTGFSYVSYPEADIDVTVSFENTPWDRVLHMASMAGGVDSAQDGKVQIVASTAALERLRSVEQVPTSGEPISLAFEDGDLAEILRMFADISGLNFVVLPGIRGKVSGLVLSEEPWERALFLVLQSQGLSHSRRNNVIVIAEPERLTPYLDMETRDYRGEVISIDFGNLGFEEILKFFEEASGMRVAADAKFEGRMTLRLTDVPWDQALDLVLTLQGLNFETRQDVIRIRAR